MNMEDENFDMTVDYTYLAEAWMFYGGSFVQALGQALMRADYLNRIKILENFKDFVADYMERAKELKAKNI